MADEYEVTADDNAWRTFSPQARYDAIHVAAGAILAGADEVTIERTRGGD